MQTVPISRWAFTLADEPGASAKGYDDSVVAQRHRAARLERRAGLLASPHSSGTGYLPGGVGWYRAHVPLRELGVRDGQHVRLVFHGVYKNADVWVNGYHLGGRPSGHAQFSFDLTEILSYAPDDDLVVSVRVDHTDISDSRWYNGSGITRRVEIQVHEQVRVREHGTVFTTLSADAARGDDPGRPDPRQRHGIAGDGARAPRAPVADLRSRPRVRNRDRGPRRRHPPTPRSPRSCRIRSCGPTPTPDCTASRRPSTWLSDGEERRAVYDETVGVRTFRFDPDSGFSINGEARVLKGVCLHEDAGCFGTAVPASVWLRRLLKLKEMGCNAVRMAHNPHAPELYALCDILGLTSSTRRSTSGRTPRTSGGRGTTSTRRGTRDTRRTSTRGTSSTSAP